MNRPLVCAVLASLLLGCAAPPVSPLEPEADSDGPRDVSVVELVDGADMIELSWAHCTFPKGFVAAADSTRAAVNLSGQRPNQRLKLTARVH